MKKIEKPIKKNQIYTGRVLKFNVDEVSLPDGKRGTRETVNHPGGVGILAIQNNNVYLVKQYRYVFKKEILEIPAGKLDKNESPLKAAKRELHEELGVLAKNIRLLGEFYPSVGYTDEIIHLYLAEDLTFDKQNLDEDEFLDIVKMPINEFEKQIKLNKIKDGKTIAAFHLYKNK